MITDKGTEVKYVENVLVLSVLVWVLLANHSKLRRVHEFSLPFKKIIRILHSVREVNIKDHSTIKEQCLTLSKAKRRPNLFSVTL